MKVIIAGTRTLTASVKEIEALLAYYDLVPTEIVCGTARGIDTSGEYYAKAKGIPVKKFPADWDTFGKVAGFKRNSQMAIYADALLLIWDGKSNGSAHMKKAMEGLNKPVFEAREKK